MVLERLNRQSKELDNIYHGSKRRKIVKLTNEGSAFVRNNVLHMRNVEEKALACMTGKEQEAYIDLSEKYAVYLREEAELYMQSKNYVEDIV